MERVENRGKFKTFFFGADYKNIGAIRSELATTENHISRLTRVKEQVEDEETKTELDEQIAVLEEAKSQAESFIKENEDKFSIFGWLIKLFN
ncbi:MAG: hypothetical protein COT81_05850 [Candidatus Buchananbacteria bacterium CG10_big_fil_rev_8_21_14_0_10_42_9]|uniref:Uncharacterized protein n=1 Tax=Candidatus Buchananbacteria bacterium CG10_big_fil_rev_8_21_14_0_10_42_9 TaxID=1974526 RepID=A0A2H0VZR5_9BACT|nr:MAG: hypothetical protein COT81_05850 [Candidatus Buchananbacteria bacterium CG10_big_fil_rev_8_21_14_0_10_42_9]